MIRRLPALPLLGPALLAAFVLLAGCATDKKKPEPKAGPAPEQKPAPAPEVPPEPLPRVMLGIDVLEAEGFKAIAGKRIGLLTHPAGVNRRGESTINVLLRAPQSKLVALFAPEHGFYGQIKAGDNFGDTKHIPTGLPIYSLHGKNRKPTKEQLKGLHALVIDLQDIGVRFYTYGTTMAYVMEEAAKRQIRVVVLDRPNPIGLHRVHVLAVDGDALDVEEWTASSGPDQTHLIEADGAPAPALEDADRAFAAATAEKGIDGWVEAFAEDGVQWARETRIEMGVSRKKRSGHMDELAAVMILKSYLDANKPIVE